MSIQSPEEKKAALESVVTKLNNDKKRRNPADNRPAVYIAGQRPDLLDHGVLTTGNIALDNILHGGIKRGNATIVWGRPGCGKSCAAYEAIAQTQANGGVPVLLHAESMFPTETARMLGVDLDNLFIIQNFVDAEEALDTLFAMLVDENNVPRNLVDLVVIDSVVSMPPKAEVTKQTKDGFESESVGLLPKLMSRFSRRASSSLGKTAMIIINQVRSEIGGYGDPQSMPGGHGLRHLADVILYMAAPKGEGMVLTEGTGKDKRIIGHTVTVRTDKNKAGLGGHPGENTSYRVIYNVGTDRTGPLFNAAVTHGIVYEVAKSYYKFDIPKEILSKYGLWKAATKGSDSPDGEPVSVHGEKAVRDIIDTCDEVRAYIKLIVLENRSPEEAVVEAATYVE